MTARAIADLAVIDVAGRGSGAEAFHRWVGLLPPAAPGAAADIRWRPSGPGGAPPAGARRTGAGGWELWGPGHAPLLPIQDVLLAKGASLVHGCGIEVGGQGVVVAGPTGTGKTVASLWALSEPGARLVSDDLVVVTAAGRVAAFPTPIALRDHHRPLLPQAASLRREARLTAAARALARLPGVRRIGRRLRAGLAGGEGRVAALVGRVKTDYYAVPPEELFTPGKLVAETRAALCVELGGDAAPSPAEAARRMLAATYENERLGEAAAEYAARGQIDLEGHRRRAADVLSAFATATGRIVLTQLPGGDVLAARRHLAEVVAQALAR